MKIIVTHSSPDWDAITSVWLLKRFLPGWENAKVMFVPAGTRYGNQQDTTNKIQVGGSPIEQMGNDQVIHVDTGMGPLDHHQTSDLAVCAASLTWDYVKTKHPEFTMQGSEKIENKLAALERIVEWVVELDHFQEVYYPDPASDRYEFGLYGLLEGLKSQKPNDDEYYLDFGMICLDAEIHNMESKIFAEKEIKEKGKEFETRYGKGLGIETINDATIKLAQKTGYSIVIRKDPRKGYVRIKALPEHASQPVILSKAKDLEKDSSPSVQNDKKGIDLTSVYEQLSKMDPEATWYLHVSKKMLLNGTPKNPKMIPTSLSLDKIIEVVKKV